MLALPCGNHWVEMTLANISVTTCVRCPQGSMSEARSTSAQACLPQESDKRLDSTWQIIGQVSLGLLAGVAGISCLVVNRRLRRCSLQQNRSKKGDRAADAPLFLMWAAQGNCIRSAAAGRGAAACAQA